MPSNYERITQHNEARLGTDTASRKTQVSMYADPTHFVYEILQNADDHGATEIRFSLSEDQIVIEHNGEPFTEDNVEAITYFGKGTSREDSQKTGRFGIGFKSVFAFTATPIIISGSEHFQIHGLYRLREYPYPKGFPRDRTRFILPFNHNTKNPDFVETLVEPKDAYTQIAKCLKQLEMNVLIFTRNLRTLHWQVADRAECYSREDAEIDDTTRLTAIRDAKTEQQYLVFSKVPTWEGEEHKPVEIAFEVNAERQIVPIENRCLHVLFPTTETTGLRFILNGPYHTTPARETINKKDKFNGHLMEVTCQLMRELLPKLRDMQFLTLQFLSVLPNREDWLSDGFYMPLYNTIVEAFQHEKLTPTKQHVYAPALGLYRDPSDGELSGLIQDADLAVLLNTDQSRPFWVASFPPRRRDEKGQFIQDDTLRRQSKRVTDFLTTLGIAEWTVPDLVDVLETKPDVGVEWLTGKSHDYHQALYMVLARFLSTAPLYPRYIASERKTQLSNLRIVRCHDNEYRSGPECHFPTADKADTDLLSGVSTDPQLLPANPEEKIGFHYVDSGVYSSAGNADNEKVYKFLEDIGVSNINEAAIIKAILEHRYVFETVGRFKSHHEKDIERFMAFLEKEPDNADLFKAYFIFEGEGFWGKPWMFFLDLPYQKTGLAPYYRIFDKDDEHRKLALSPNYRKTQEDIEKFIEFALKVGVKTEVAVIEQGIPEAHPDYDDLVATAPGGRITQASSINTDWTLPNLEPFLNTFTGATEDVLVKAELIWRVIGAQPQEHLEARFRKNKRYETRVRPSTLVYTLRHAPWVPQETGDALSFVCPCDAVRELLPKDRFPWTETHERSLAALEFGEVAKTAKEEHTEQHRKANEFGFQSANDAENAAAYFEQMGVSPEEALKKLKSQKRRKELLIIDLNAAEERGYEMRARSIRATQPTLHPGTLLRARYTTETGTMYCQMCSEQMPFKKRNSDEDYFEAVEALGKRYFFKEHEAQYLALCPECAAKYKEFVKRDPKHQAAFYEALARSDTPEISLESNGEIISIRFDDKHWQDLKTIVYYYENLYDPNAAD